MGRTVKRGRPTAADFFAGSGLVTEALRRWFDVVWANDISSEKAWVYRANHGNEHLRHCPIEEVDGNSLPPTTLSWASFPCQDLSLAGNMGGIGSQRSGLVWQWLRILDEQPQRPPILVAENVVGLISGHGGADYARLHAALDERGYRVGVVMLDAVHWVPHSRPRVFVVALSKSVDVPKGLSWTGPGWCHSDAIIRAATAVNSWVWWALPEPPERKTTLADIIEWDAASDGHVRRKHVLSLVSPRHQLKADALSSKGDWVLPGYRRTRQNHQVLELRFDGVAGCLRTPGGGSSRQVLLLRRDGKPWQTRLLTVRETARLMGASDKYVLPEGYNDGYRAMGDAVAVPAASWLAKHLLKPLADKATRQL